MSTTPDPEPAPERDPRPAPRRPAGPPPLEKPSRSATTMRDMIGAIVILGVIVLSIGGIARGCSFSPGGPTVDDGRLPVVDAPAQLRYLAPLVPIPLRVPAVPAGWRSNSVGQDRIESGAAPSGPAARAVVTGYLTPAGRYLRFAQSDASEEALLTWAAGASQPVGRGSVDVDGVSWVVYERPDDEPVWIAAIPATGGAPAVRLLITGSGAEPDFRTLAAAAATGEVLPLGSAPS